jgi:hypothetical protein
MQSILDYGFPLRSGTQNELEPRPLALSGPARKAWIAFADHIERELGKSGSLVPVKGLANKLPEHAARLAGVLTLVQDIEAAEVAEDMFLAGVELAQHYVREALRLFGAAQVGADIKLAQRLLAWIANDWTEPSVSLPDIYQFGPNAIRDKATAEKIAGILEDHGWLVRESKGGTVRGIHRRVVWRLAEAE